MAAALTIDLRLGGTEETARRAGKRPALRIWHAPATEFSPKIVRPEKPESKDRYDETSLKPPEKIKFRKFTRASWINKYSLRSANE